MINLPATSITHSIMTRGIVSGEIVGGVGQRRRKRENAKVCQQSL